MNESTLDAVFRILPVPTCPDPPRDSKDDDRSFDKHLSAADSERRTAKTPSVSQEPAPLPSCQSEVNRRNSKNSLSADRSSSTHFSPKTDAPPNTSPPANDDHASNSVETSTSDSGSGEDPQPQEESVLGIYPALDATIPTSNSPGLAQISELEEETIELPDQVNEANARSTAELIAQQSSMISDRPGDHATQSRVDPELSKMSAENQPIGTDAISPNAAKVTLVSADPPPVTAISEDTLADQPEQDQSSHSQINPPADGDMIDTVSDVIDSAAKETGDRGVQDPAIAPSLDPASDFNHQGVQAIPNNQRHQRNKASGVGETSPAQEKTTTGDFESMASRLLLPPTSTEAALHVANASDEASIESSPRTSNDSHQRSFAPLQTDSQAGTVQSLARTLEFGISAERSKTDTSLGRLQIDPERFVARVARAFQLAEDRGGPIRLRLSPPELGSVRLELVVKNGVLSATIETETTTARHALLDHLPALRERLADQNIRVEQFDIDVRDETNGRQQEQTPDPFGYQSQSGTSNATHRNSQKDGDPTRPDPSRRMTRPRGDEIIDVVA